MGDSESRHMPLRGLNGVAPPAPDWFVAATQAPYETFSVTVEGVPIDCRAWGERGAPGLLLLHGNTAHLGWWSFLASFFAKDRRVVSLSFSGMGGSGWRERYEIRHYVEEAWAAAETGGASASGPPVLVGHSMGGLPVLRTAARLSGRMRAGILVDTALPGPEMMAARISLTHRTYADLPEALARFRLSPSQPCENLWAADYVARMALKPLADGQYAWSFDRGLLARLDVGDPWSDLENARVPLAVIRGEKSQLTGGAMAARMRKVAPAATRFMSIPEAYHHVMIDQPIALVSVIRALLAEWA